MSNQICQKLLSQYLQISLFNNELTPESTECNDTTMMTDETRTRNMSTNHSTAQRESITENHLCSQFRDSKTATNQAVNRKLYDYKEKDIRSRPTLQIRWRIRRTFLSILLKLIHLSH